MSYEALNTHLNPINNLLSDKDIHEISINKQNEVWFSKNGIVSSIEIKEFTFKYLLSLADLAATACSQNIDKVNPLLSGTLPNGNRIQIVIPPACSENHVIISIRKQTLVNLTIDDYAKYGAFDFVEQNKTESIELKKLNELYKNNEYKEFIKYAVKTKKTILISGGTDTGKTTFMNACITEIPLSERILSIEDSEEIKPPHPNRVALFFSRGNQGISKATPQQLLETSLRLRPDRIIVGELRGSEAFSFLRAINTGHEGSMTTLHADTPNLAIDQIALMVLQAGLGISKKEIKEYVTSIIDIVVQLNRDSSGKRYISEIIYKG